VVALAEAGDAAEISALVDAELERAEREQTLSMTPELLRIRGELLRIQGSPETDLAEGYFRLAMERAHAQGALSWELRAAMSLALLQQSKGRTSEARQLLQSRYDRFTEGFGSYDLKRAKRLLDEWQLAQGPQRREHDPGSASA
jgi:predicted ATPase